MIRSNQAPLPLQLTRLPNGDYELTRTGSEIRLSFTAAEINAFKLGVKAGEFDIRQRG